jgi:predicted Zn finger-like uncharacterized protein
MLTKLLKCPRCSSGFRVSADAIFDGGRQVRCSVCTHAWLANPLDLRPDTERENTPSLDEIIESLAPQEEAPADVVSEAVEDSVEAVAAADAFSDDFADMVMADFPDAEMNIAAQRAAPSPYLRLKMGLLVGNIAVAFTVLLLSALLFRDGITAMLPFTRTLYNAVGYADTKDIQLANLSFSRTATNGVDRYGVKGEIVNHGKRVLPAPSVRARLFTKDGEMLKEWLLSTPDTLKPEDARAFNARNLKSGYSSGHMLALEIGSPVELMLRK